MGERVGERVGEKVGERVGERVGETSLCRAEAVAQKRCGGGGGGAAQAAGELDEEGGWSKGEKAFDG